MRNWSVLLVGLGMITGSGLVSAQEAPSQAQLLERIKQLEERLSRVERLSGLESCEPSVATPAQSTTATVAQAPQTLTKPSPELPGGITLNVNVDGYYQYNFNNPIGRVNLLRAYDVLSNSFSLNQAGVILERAPNPDIGRRFGLRLDLQFGQATETLQGGAQNELRPQVYRHLFQAYGTYVVPLGKGLSVDFGKFASSLGYENNYTQFQINYSRSYWFNFLPFYHMGFRTSYTFNDKLTFTNYLVNGVNQTEDFNGAKSAAFLFTINPNKKVSWNVNYYFGEEALDVVPVLNPGFPLEATQPGLPVQNVTPAPNGKRHIFDTYASWNAGQKLLLVGEGDFVINRVFETSPPTRVFGGAAYARYQFTTPFSLGARFEYLGDDGGLFSGRSQALKEATLTAAYQFTEGFQAKMEWRRDFSNVPFFLSSTPGQLKKQQNTALLGLIWWFGGKPGPW
jgi:Putative beta-barrel porin-2, OmpL-like. bbp2